MSYQHATTKNRTMIGGMDFIQQEGIAATFRFTTSLEPLHHGVTAQYLVVNL